MKRRLPAVRGAPWKTAWLAMAALGLLLAVRWASVSAPSAGQAPSHPEVVAAADSPVPAPAATAQPPAPVVVVAGVFGSGPAVQVGAAQRRAVERIRAQPLPAPAPGAPPLAPHPRWPGASILSQTWSRPDGAGRVRRVTLVQPPELPYPIRIEELLPAPGAAAAPQLLAEESADRIVVQLQPGATPAELAGLAAAIGATVERRISARGLYRLQLARLTPDGAPEAVAALAAAPPAQGKIRFAETDPVARAAVTPDDPLFLDGSQWNLATIQAPAGWDVRTDASPVIVAVIDTGVKLDLADLAPNLWTNPGESGLDALGHDKTANGVDDDGNGYVDDVYGINAITGSGNPDDTSGHGTQVSGVLAARGNNAAAMAGVAWTARLLVAKFLTGTPASGIESDAIECLDYAVAMGAGVSNNSWGSDASSQALLEAVRAARDADHLFIAAAGNDGHDNDLNEDAPSGLEVDNIVSVAATTNTDSLWVSSNFGFGRVQVAAPGKDIESLSHFGENVYFTSSGTSLAAPHVTGAAALLRSQFPAENFAQILNRLLRGVDTLPALAGKVQTGGRLNLHRALALSQPTPPNDAPGDAFPLPANVPRVRATNRAATASKVEPAPADTASGASIWYMWTSGNAPAPVAFSTEGSDFDTVLTIFNGPSPEMLWETASNDDARPGVTSSDVAFLAEENTTYYIQVAGKVVAGEPAQGLVILQTKPLLTLTSQPLSTGAPPGGAATIKVGADGVPAPSYQWQASTDGGQHWSDLPAGPFAAGTTAAQLQLTALPESWNGRQFRCLVQNAFSQETTAAATLTVADFGAAVGAPELTFATGGVAPWFPETDTAFTGPYALRTGRVDNLQETWLETTVLGPGNFSFRWKVSSEKDFDYLRFEVDGVEKDKIAGETGWTLYTQALGPGLHALRWRYPKDPFVFEGQDTGWLDDVVWQPLTVMPAYAEWTASLGLSGASAAPTAQPFPDGLPNLARYAMNLGTAPAPGHLPAVTFTTAEDPSRLKLQYRRGKGLENVELIAEYSADLEHWQPVPPGQIVALADDDAQTGRFEASIAVPPGGRIFLRLVAVQTVPQPD